MKDELDQQIKEREARPRGIQTVAHAPDTSCPSTGRVCHWNEFQDEEYRYAYAEDFLNTWIATQIVTLREQRGLSQAELGELIGTKQPGISLLENVNHSTWETETLKRLARALGVRLKITFETFGSLLEEDLEFSRKFLERPVFNQDPAAALDFVHQPPPPCAVRESPGYESKQAQREIRHIFAADAFWPECEWPKPTADSKCVQAQKSPKREAMIVSAEALEAKGKA